MCGRFILLSSAKSLAEEFELCAVPEIQPRYNIAPSQELLAITPQLDETSSKRRPQFMRWGLIPSWTKDASRFKSLINARSETIQSKPAFRSSFRKRRILIPSNGFYEWKNNQDGQRKAYLIHLEGLRLFAFAGIFDEWKSPKGEIVKTCAILTTSSNNSMKSIHDRMPVIVKKSDYAIWLESGELKEKALRNIFETLSDQSLIVTPVSSMVNSPRNDEPGCIIPDIVTP